MMEHVTTFMKLFTLSNCVSIEISTHTHTYNAKSIKSIKWNNITNKIYRDSSIRIRTQGVLK